MFQTALKMMQMENTRPLILPSALFSCLGPSQFPPHGFHVGYSRSPGGLMPATWNTLAVPAV